MEEQSFNINTAYVKTMLFLTITCQCKMHGRYLLSENLKHRDLGHFCESKYSTAINILWLQQLKLVDLSSIYYLIHF